MYCIFCGYLQQQAVFATAEGGTFFGKLRRRLTWNYYGNNDDKIYGGSSDSGDSGDGGSYADSGTCTRAMVQSPTSLLWKIEIPHFLKPSP